MAFNAQKYAAERFIAQSGNRKSDDGPTDYSFEYDQERGVCVDEWNVYMTRNGSDTQLHDERTNTPIGRWLGGIAFLANVPATDLDIIMVAYHIREKLPELRST